MGTQDILRGRRDFIYLILYFLHGFSLSELSLKQLRLIGKTPAPLSPISSTFSSLSWFLQAASVPFLSPWNPGGFSPELLRITRRFTAEVSCMLCSAGERVLQEPGSALGF